jgi:hypothetical protein
MIIQFKSKRTHFNVKLHNNFNSDNIHGFKIVYFATTGMTKYGTVPWL